MMHKKVDTCVKSLMLVWRMCLWGNLGSSYEHMIPLLECQVQRYYHAVTVNTPSSESSIQSLNCPNWEHEALWALAIQVWSSKIGGLGFSSLRLHTTCKDSLSCHNAFFSHVWEFIRIFERVRTTLLGNPSSVFKNWGFRVQKLTEAPQLWGDS